MPKKKKREPYCKVSIDQDGENMCRLAGRFGHGRPRYDYILQMAILGKVVYG